MRLGKILTVSLLTMVIAMSYVHQRLEIIKLGYTVQENKKYLSRLVDQNSKLMYNLSKLESPKSLLTKLDAEKVEFASQRIGNSETYMISVAYPEEVEAADGFIGKILDVFTVNAEAKTKN